MCVSFWGGGGVCFWCVFCLCFVCVWVLTWGKGCDIVVFVMANYLSKFTNMQLKSGGLDSTYLSKPVELVVVAFAFGIPHHRLGLSEFPRVVGFIGGYTVVQEGGIGGS